MNENIIIDGLDDVEIENTSVDEIDSESINLMFLGIDKSGSMGMYETDMKKSLGAFKDALENSKDANEILIARSDFSDYCTIGGYKKIQEFETNFKTSGMTAMYDTIVKGVEKLKEYREFLRNQGMRVKAVFAIFGDGQDNVSSASFSTTKNAMDFLNNEEITTAFISFGGDADQIAKDLGFRNILNVSSNSSELRNAFNCLSKSVIESSKSVVSDGDDFFTM